MPDERYDVFVSYKSEYLPWVAVLARNLQGQGFSVWLDEWRRVPGNPVGRSLEQALDASRTGVLVVTPEAAQSGWVQSEYEQMRHRQRRGDAFRFVPAILAASEGFAFVRELFAVDFRDATTGPLYRRRLHELVCGLRGEAPGEGDRLVGQVVLPPTVAGADRAGERARLPNAFDALLDDVELQRVAAAFAQEGAQHLTSVEVLVAAARERFRGWDVRHLVPLVCEADRATDYFAHAARRFGVADPVSDAFALGRGLAQRLDRGDCLLLVVSHMENGPDGVRRAFAAQVRQLLEQYPGQLRLLFVGGDRLDELVFSSSQALSLLSNAAATAHDWPAPDTRQVRELARDPGLGDTEVAMLLDVTGAEPRLLAECLRRRPMLEAGSADAYAEIVRNSVVVRQWFTPFGADETYTARACRLLDQADLGPFDRIRDDEVRRRLYWRGALRKLARGGIDRLTWRSAATRERGKELLGCERS